MTDARLWHSWLRINRVLRVMLHTRWSAEAWPQVKAEFKKALALRCQSDSARGVVQLGWQGRDRRRSQNQRRRPRVVSSRWSSASVVRTHTTSCHLRMRQESGAGERGEAQVHDLLAASFDRLEAPVPQGLA